MIEMLACIAVTAVLLSLVGAAQVSFVNYIKRQERQVQVLVDVQRAQRLIVRDVRCASDLPGAHAGYEAGPSTLICRVPAHDPTGDSAPASSVVVYTIGGPDGRSLVRTVFADGGTVATAADRVLIEDVASVTFERSTSGPAETVQCTITVPENRMYTSRPAVYSFVVGGRHE
jgi:type II secretory pathway pseudopilin PulG